MSRMDVSLISDIEQAEIAFMRDRMEAIRERPGNPEGIEVVQFGHATCYYSRTMPWAWFNTVKGVRDKDVNQFSDITTFYRERDRKGQFEVVPGLASKRAMVVLAELGYMPVGHHSSFYIEPQQRKVIPDSRIEIQTLCADEDSISTYARIHCLGTELGEAGIPHVTANNRVLIGRPGWHFYRATYDGAAAAVGVMCIIDGLASLTFAATLPEFRGRGLQQALLDARIQEAANQSCRLAVAQCAFLSTSHRNMERSGMKMAYVRTGWMER